MKQTFADWYDAKYPPEAFYSAKEREGHRAITLITWNAAKESC